MEKERTDNADQEAAEEQKPAADQEAAEEQKPAADQEAAEEQKKSEFRFKADICKECCSEKKAQHCYNNKAEHFCPMYLKNVGKSK